VRKAGLIWAQVIATGWIPPHKMIVKMHFTDGGDAIFSYDRIKSSTGLAMLVMI
jgi:hypothetical protein